MVMTDTLQCPECGTAAETADDLETGGTVTEVEVDEDGSFSLFENRDLHLCKGCRNPLGVSRS